MQYSLLTFLSNLLLSYPPLGEFRQNSSLHTQSYA
jgi:hypothetical protein